MGKTPIFKSASIWDNFIPDFSRHSSRTFSQIYQEPPICAIPFVTMYQDAFTKLEQKEVAALLETFNPLFEGSKFTPAETTIMAQNTPFYPGLRYLDIADYACVPPMHRFVIEGPDKAVILNWSNEPIYQLNQSHPLELNEETVCDYVRFFFSHVRGKNGRFLIVESIDDIRWKEDPPPTARKSIGKMLLPLTMTPKATDGSYTLPVTVMFKDSLFQCNVQVLADGTINMDNEELLIEDMPVLDDAFGQ